VKTVDIRVLVDDNVDSETLTRRMIGHIPFGANMFDGVHAAEELDENGIPVPRFPSRTGVQWNGWAIEVPTVRYSMTTVNAGTPVSHTRQQVTVYAYEDGVTKVVARGQLTMQDSGPESVRVSSQDGSAVYTTDGEWVPIEGLWVCTARIKEAR
jgi:hypothetical protein